MLDGKYLKYLRQQKDATQTEVADKLGIPMQSYSRKEREGTFKAEELNTIRMYLNLTNDEYFRILDKNHKKGE